MVATRGKKKTASSDKTLDEKEAAENGSAETQFSDSLIVDVVEPNEDTQLGDGVGLVADEARNEDSGEEGEKVAIIDNEDLSMPVTKLNDDDNKAESEENTFEDDDIDDQEDMLFEDEAERFEHENEERILDELDVSEDEASEEDDRDAEVSGEEATEEDEVSDEEATKEENYEENNQEEKENAIQDTREAKGKEEGGGAKEHGIEKSEASLKNINKSNEKTRKKKVQASRLKKVDSQEKPESSQKRKVKKRVESMGMIFMCSSETKKDCYQYKVLGLPESKKDIVEKIYTGMRLFLYDVDLKLMYGIYKAAGPGGYNIEPKAFKRQFPSQVRFKVMENCLPLPEEKFKTIIKANYFTRTKFDCKLNSEQVKKLCKLFTVSSKGHPSKKLGRSLKTEKQHIRQEKNKRQRTGDKRRLPLREDARHHERPRKRQRKVISPAAVPRQRLPAPLPSTAPSSYVYSRADAYRPGDRRDRPLDPYSGARDPPRERNVRYRDGRDPHIERRYAYRGGLDSHIDRPDPYIDYVDSYSRRRDPDPYRDGRDLFLEPRDLYRDGRDPYIERRDSYRDGRDPYIERRDSYRDGRASYLERRVPYGDSAHSDLYSTYRRIFNNSSCRRFRLSYTMLGGLYGDLPPPSSTADDNSTTTSTTNVWSSSAKMAPPTLRKPFAPPQTILRPKPPQPKPAPPPAASKHPAVSQPAADENRNPNPSATAFQPALVGVTSSVHEEYDPARPNDYEEYRRERKRKQAEAEVRRELEERERREREREERERREREKDREKELSISGEEAWRRRAAMGGGGGGMPRSPSPPPNVNGGDEGFRIGKSESGGLGLGAEGKMTAAQRMMAKMGWKEGQGLGKQEQGITTPLMAKKTDKRGGVIVNASESSKKVKSVSFNGPPTRVVLLRNMVGPGEVDDDLEGEVAEECSKFGTVTRVLIFEITEPNFPHEEAVRIFIQFERAEHATKALIELEGRFFGGRVVRAGFYDEERFGNNELAPMPGEIPGFF